MNDEFSGGEKNASRPLQLAVLEPKFAMLDEIDSGLDVDALRDVARRVEAMTKENDLGVLAITHYARLLSELPPDRVHVLMGGQSSPAAAPSSPTSSRRPATRAWPPSWASRSWRSSRRPKPTPSPNRASSFPLSAPSAPGRSTARCARL